VSLFLPEALSAHYRETWSGHVAVLSPGNVPTVDFYMTPRLAELPSKQVHAFDSRVLDPVAQSLPVGTFVIIVRHAVAPWLRFIRKHASRWSGVAFLIDDDIPAAWRCKELPLDYRLRTSARFLRVARDLSSVCDRAWVSTDELRNRYRHWNPVVLPPLSPFQPRQAAPSGVRRWCYHGTRAHQDEINWLKPVVREVQNRVPNAEFEIMGGAGIRRLFAGVPRVNVLPTCVWPEYVAHCENSDIAVGLAPLLPGYFNAARAHVKIFDIANAGAVGVYSRRAPYFPDLAAAGAAFVDDDQAAWSEQIAALLNDDARRMALFSQAMDWIDNTPLQPGIRELIDCP
jgi:hypothetical protein